MKTTLISHLLQVAADVSTDRSSTNRSANSGNGLNHDSFYLDAMNIATEAYDAPLRRLGFCYRTIKTAHDMRRQAAASESLSDETMQESALHVAMSHIRSSGTFSWQSTNYALSFLWRTLRRPIVGGGFSFAQLATACVALIVVAGIWLPSKQSVDETEAPFRGVKPVGETTDNSGKSPTPTQISLSVLMLNALIVEAGLGDRIDVVATESAIEISGGLDDEQFITWNSQVLSEYQKRGGVVALLNQTIEKL